jgi:hypothetical protein
MSVSDLFQDAVGNYGYLTTLARVLTIYLFIYLFMYFNLFTTYLMALPTAHTTQHVVKGEMVVYGPSMDMLLLVAFPHFPATTEL